MLAYEQCGSGEPLVLIHGMGHRRQAWYPVVDRLAEHHDVIMVDLPGHGQSPDLDLNGRSLHDALHGEILGFFNALGLERAHVAGNSLGGRIALEVAAAGCASSVIALAPAAFWRGPVDFQYIRRLFGIVTTGATAIKPLVPLLSRTAAGRSALLSWLVANPHALDARTAHDDFDGLVRALPIVRAVLAAASSGEAGPFEGVVPPEVPVTIAWGTRDYVLLPYQARRARALLPTATHVTLRGCGHVPMADNPAMVASVILDGAHSAAIDDDLELIAG